MMLRALHVYSGNLYGGVERLLVTLARHRAACEDLQPRFALCFRGRLSRELEAEAVAVDHLGEVRASRPLSVWRARRRLAALLWRETPDIVICHSPWAQALLGPVAVRARLPLVLWVHNPLQRWGWPERWAKRVVPDSVVANSRFTARSVAGLYPVAPTEVVYCPVAPEPATAADRAKIRTEFETPDDAVVIVQVSRLESWKGHALLLRALGRLREVPGWVCWQVGGPQRPREAAYLGELKRLAETLQIAGRVRFAGARSDIGAVLAAADVHCQPNLGPEPFGIAFVEALLAGLPVVTTDLGAVPEILSADCALVVPPGDAAPLAGALRVLIEDEALRARLSAAAPARARRLCDPAAQISLLHRALSDTVCARRATATGTPR